MFYRKSPANLLFVQLVLILGLSLPGTAAFGAPAAPSDKPATVEVRIGLRAHLGAETALKLWGPTADYLSAQIPGYHFLMLPFETIGALNEAASRHEFDFVFTNPSSFVELEMRYGGHSLLTLVNKHQGQAYTRFGSVIFTRADRDDINNLQDLKGKTFMAVSEQAFGGWRVAWREMLDQDIDPYTDIKQLVWGGGHQPNVVEAVLDGRVDAGTVRTDLLERMAADGHLDLNSVKILNRQQAANFPLLLSTRLYPEWPFAKLTHTDDRLAQQVARALLAMPADDPAAIAGKYMGWHTPLDHREVHALMKKLGVGPYAPHGDISLQQLISQYWQWLLAILLLAALAIGTITRMRILNTRLKASQNQLHQMARHDSLTGVANRYRLTEFLNQEWGQAVRMARPVSVILFDIDSFKRYNDHYGHVAGDECLKQVASFAESLFRRAGELLVRYGGEEFLVVLTAAKSGEAEKLAESLRQQLEQLHIPHAHSSVSDHVTVSLGVATQVPKRNSTPEQLIHIADTALYRAKQGGRNRVVVADE